MGEPGAACSRMVAHLHVASWYMKRYSRCGPLMHRVDEDQRINGGSARVSSARRKNAILMKLYMAGGALIGTSLPGSNTVQGRYFVWISWFNPVDFLGDPVEIC